MRHFLRNSISSISLISLLAACGGGGGSGSGMVIEGELTQGTVVTHSASLRHSEGQTIENVNICALGECATTDAQGQWGFVAPDDFTGGEVEFTINGHGIDSSTVVDIPDNAQDVSIHFQNNGDEGVSAIGVIADGVEVLSVDGHHHD